MTGANPVLRAFGERLRLLRKARGWTQEELARRTNRHWTYIGGLERGERNPTLLVLSDLVTTLDVRPSDLLDEDHELLRCLNASAKDILDAIQRGFRAQIDVKGKLAELYMNHQLDAFRASGLI